VAHVADVRVARRHEAAAVEVGRELLFDCVQLVDLRA
jgi:hypothetical protein